MRTSTCPSAQQWQQLLLGQASQAEAELLESHLAECTLCLQVVRGIREVDTLAEEMRSRATPPDRPIPEPSIITTERRPARLAPTAMPIPSSSREHW